MTLTNRSGVVMALGIGWANLGLGTPLVRAEDDPVMVFSYSSMPAQPAVVYYEKLPGEISKTPQLFGLAEERIKLEGIAGNALIPARNDRVTPDTNPPLVDRDGVLPPGITEDDLRDADAPAVSDGPTHTPEN